MYGSSSELRLPDFAMGSTSSREEATHISARRGSSEIQWGLSPNALASAMGSATERYRSGQWGLSPNSAASTRSYCANVVNKGNPQGEDHEEADQLLQIVRAQVVTQNSALEAAPERQRPGAAQNETQRRRKGSSEKRPKRAA